MFHFGMDGSCLPGCMSRKLGYHNAAMHQYQMNQGSLFGGSFLTKSLSEARSVPKSCEVFSSCSRAGKCSPKRHSAPSITIQVLHAYILGPFPNRTSTTSWAYLALGLTLLCLQACYKLEQSSLLTCSSHVKIRTIPSL